MIRVEISFDTYKHLMLRRRDETHSLDDVIRELAGLEPAPPVGRRAWFQKDLSLRHGTELRAPYKGAFYPAAIVDGEWIKNGEVMSSPSAAARAITGNSVNGWDFWEAKQPGDESFTSLKALQARWHAYETTPAQRRTHERLN